MKSCPACGRDSMSVDDERKFRCDACDTVVFHEGNGYVVETGETI